MLSHRFNNVQDSAGDANTSWSVTAYPIGGIASASATSTTINLNTPHSFTVGDKFLRNPGVDDTFSGTDTVQSVTATTIVMSQSYTFVSGDTYVNLGADTGTASPNYDASKLIIYSDPDGGTAVSNSTVTSDSTTGEYDYYHKGDGTFWELFRDSTGSPKAVMKGFGGVPGRLNVNDYGLSVAGIQAALDAAGQLNGMEVFIQSDANITLASTSIKIPNRVKLIGYGDHTSSPTFVGDASTNVSAMVENKDQDGTQQYAYVEGIYLNGNRAAGGTTTRGLYFKGVFVGSAIKDVLVTNCSGNGIAIDGGDTTVVGCGPFPVINVTVTGCNDDNILVNGACDGIYFYQCSSESVVATNALVHITGNGAATSSSSHAFFGLHFEGSTACDGLLLDECSNVTAFNVTHDGSGANNVIKITGSTAGSDGAFASGGHVFVGVRGNFATIIDDQVASVSLGNTQSRFIRWYTSPVHDADLDTSQVVGIQPARQGVDIASAATVTPATGSSFYVVTGTTDITSITANARDKGRLIMLQFTNAAPGDIIHGSNIVLAGAANFSPAQNDAIILGCDGTNWIEASPR